MVDQRVEAALGFVASYAPEISEWKILKRELLLALNPDARKLFSTRDPVTKIQNFNDFEKSVAARWSQITGTELIFTGKK